MGCGTEHGEATHRMAAQVGENFELAGWLFESESHPILSTRECDALTGRLNEACERGARSRRGCARVVLRFSPCP